MPVVMTHKEWMKLTYGGVTSIRSSKLKAVDAALDSYHKRPADAHLDALRKALLAWIGDKSGDWKNSVRNAKNAVDTLHKQVMGLGGSDVDAQGLKTLEAGAQQMMLTLFERGARVGWKNE